MFRRRPDCPVCLLVLPLLLFSATANPLCGQEDPFGAPLPKAADAGKATDAPRPPAGGKAAAAKVDATEREPLAIELLRASNPSTPRDLLSAARAAFQYSRADEAKIYLAKLLNDKPADEALAPLTARYPEFLLQIASHKDLQPEGRNLADLILAASQRVKQNPERLAMLVTQLSDPSTGIRQQAMDQFAAAGTAAANPLLQGLADRARDNEHASIRSALVGLGSVVESPLIAVLESHDVNLKQQVIAVLARMKSQRAAVQLVRPALDSTAPTELRELAAAALLKIVGAVPDRSEAVQFLRRELDRLLAGDVPQERDSLDHVQLWQWNDAQREVAPLRLPRRDAGVLLAARVATDLAALVPADAVAQRLLLLTNLEMAQTAVGLDQPLPTEPGTIGSNALAAGPRALNDVLSTALRGGHIASAVAAATLLSHVGDATVLHTPSGESPLAEAMRYSERRVRLAAALTAAKLSPIDAFPGASRMSETLAWFAATSDENRVLVGHPRGEDAQMLVAFAAELGFAGESVAAGRAFAERAFSSPDYEFVLVSDAIDSPPVEELVQWLRRDFRTARLPIGVMALSERMDALRESFANDPYTIVFPRIYSLEVASVEIEKLNAIAGQNLISRDERVANARSALAAFANLASHPNNLSALNLLRHEPVLIAALNRPALSSQSAAVLALFGTPQSQAALLDAASQTGRPLADRQAAATAFASAVNARGLLLTQAQIAQQYDRYNASAALDRPTQELLGSILDIVESPASIRR